MKTAIKTLPATLTQAVAVAPTFPETQAPIVGKLDDASLNILAAAAPLSPVKAEKPVKAEVVKAVPPRAAIHAAATLLELVQALDGSKEQRYNVALDALTAAYTTALTYGNKSELIAVMQSTGKKACERGMRTAIQIVGALGYHKDASTRQDAINAAVATAMTVFADIACKPPVKRAPAVPAPATDAVAADGAGEGVAEAAPDTDAAPSAGAAPMDIVGYAQMLPDLALADLIDSLLKVAAARHVPLLKAA